jgi:hypothetical protein
MCFEAVGVNESVGSEAEKKRAGSVQGALAKQGQQVRIKE